MTNTSTTTSAAPVRPGEIVRVLVHPRRNAGNRETTAIVTAVNNDGTAELQLLLPDSAPRVTGRVFASRTEADAHVAEQFAHLPQQAYDDEGELIVGKNPRTNKDWRDYDVLDWITPAWPTDPHPAVQALAVQHEALAAQVRQLKAGFDAQREAPAAAPTE